MRKFMSALLAGLAVVAFGLPAVADSMGPGARTGAMHSSTSWEGANGSSTSYGTVNALRSGQNWHNYASFSVSSSGDNGWYRGAYGNLEAYTDKIMYVPKPGGGSMPTIARAGSSAETGRTRGSLSGVVTTTLSIGNDQRNGWDRQVQVCLDLKLRPDHCSSATHW